MSHTFRYNIVMKMEKLGMKKKILALVICFCLSLSIFTGCTLFQKDTLRYNNQVVAKVGNQTITREEVVNMYYTYYYNYYYYIYGYSEDELMSLVYDSLVTRKVILEEAKQIIQLKNSEVNELWEQVYENMQDTLDSKVKTMLENDGYDEESDLYKEYFPEEESSTKYIYKLYELETLPKPDYTNFNPNDVELSASNNVLPKEEDYTKDYMLKAYKEWVTELIQSARLAGKSTDVNDVLQAELNRQYKVFEESKYIEKYQEYIEGQNLSIGNEAEAAKLVLEKYEMLLTADQQTYGLLGNYETTMNGTDNDNLVLYHNPNSQGYFQVQHILVSFTAEQKKVLESMDGYDEDKDAIYREEYLQKLEEFMNDLITSENGIMYRENYDDEETYKEISAQDSTLTFVNLQAELDALVNALQKGGSYADYAQGFNKLMYKYSADPGLITEDSLSQFTGYYVPLDSEENGAWIKEFADASRDLYTNSYENGFADERYYTMVATSNGVHIIMITGEVQKGNLVNFSGIENDNSAKIQALQNTFISLREDKSVYDYLYELVLADQQETFFNTYMGKKVEELEKNGTIVYYYKTYDEIMG